MKETRKQRLHRKSPRKTSAPAAHTPTRGNPNPTSADSVNSVTEDQRPRLGAEAAIEKIVPHEWTIQALNPRLPAVFSTPAMIGLMEGASVLAVQQELPPGAITVGTRIEVDHLKAVPVGAKVRASARLVGYQGRFLIFDVEARSGEHLIGRGKVFRAIVESGSHGEKARARVRRPPKE